MPRTFTNTGQFLDTVGVEFESVGLNAAIASTIIKELDRILEKNLFALTRDASTESFRIPLRVAHTSERIPLYLHTELASRLVGTSQYEKQPNGFEIISIPMEIKFLEPAVFHALRLLSNHGDFISERASTHYHIGFAINLRMLKNLLKLCLWLDPLLFRLGGMGGIQRGYINQSAYARPLLYPSIVKIGENFHARTPAETRILSSVENRRGGSKKHVQIINVEGALSADSMEDFWRSFGIFPEFLGTPKYHPCRYTACNFYALVQHGTIEFRHFNQTLNSSLVVAIGKFLRASVELSTLLNKNEVQIFQVRDPLVQISDSEAIDSLRTLRSLFASHEIEQTPSEDDWGILADTVLKSTFLPISKKYVKTHLSESSALIPRNLANLGKLTFLPKNVITPSSHVDSHNIQINPIIQGDE